MYRLLPVSCRPSKRSRVLDRESSKEQVNDSDDATLIALCGFSRIINRETDNHSIALYFVEVSVQNSDMNLWLLLAVILQNRYFASNCIFIENDSSTCTIGYFLPKLFSPLIRQDDLSAVLVPFAYSLGREGVNANANFGTKWG